MIHPPAIPCWPGAAPGVAGLYSLQFSVSALPQASAISTPGHPNIAPSSRLEIVPARTVGEADQIRPPSLQDQPASFLTEVQALTSRPVIKDAVVRLKGDTALPDLRGDPADWLQQLVRAAPVEHTQVVELSAEGPQKDLLWRLVNAVTDAYRARTGQRYRDQIAGNYSDLKDELGKLHDQAVVKRTSVDAFRDANNIVSLERDENGVLADIENLSHSYSSSVEDLAKAQGRLQAMKKVSGTGAKLVGGKDDPTIAALEQQAAMLRDELTDLRRRYTPAYLALDSDATALTERIAGLEKQIAAQRAASQQSALATAEEDFETAQAEVERLRGELADNQKKAQHFAAGLARFKSMQDDLDHLENIERLTADRLSKMQASERESAPKVQILERAVPSLYPVGPDYTKNAAVAVSGSFALGILAVWFARFVGGSAAEPRWAEQPLPVQSWQAPVLSRIPAEPPRLSPASRVINFLPQKPPAREIGDQELSTLMAGASEPVVLACVGLLSGLTPGELTTLRWNEIDFENHEIGWMVSRPAFSLWTAHC